jgi:PAS domain-containing protein
MVQLVCFPQQSSARYVRSCTDETPHLSHSGSVSRAPAYQTLDAAAASEETAAGPWVDTDPYGRVIDASPEGARLFNLTVRGLTGRNLSLFFMSRQLIADGLMVLRRGHRECPLLETEYRPMERRRRSLRVKMWTADGDAVRWTFSEVLGDGSGPLFNPT